MPPSRKVPREAALEDDYPVRPRSARQDETDMARNVKRPLRMIILSCFVAFFYGSGISLYGPLYPKLARHNGLHSYIYGSVIATSHFVCLLSYLVAYRMVASISGKLSVSVSIFIIGACRILFGTLDLIAERVPFIVLSFAIQAVEGIGMSILLASTILIVWSHTKDSFEKISLAIHVSLCAGLTVGPIVGETVKEYLGFGAAFYIVGGLMLGSFVFTAIFLPQPDQQITHTDVPITGWIKNKNYIIYFLITFATFNYVGFLSVCLESILKQFHLQSIYVGLLFSLTPFAYGLLMPLWTWLIRKWFHSVLTIFIGSLFIFGSLILLGPAPFTSLDPSLVYVSSALLLTGVGIACKCACIAESLRYDLSHLKNLNDIQRHQVIPTVLCLGTYLGYFAGSLIAGLTKFYTGYKKATLILFTLEIIVAVTSIIFAFNRNYVSKRRRGTVEEQREILRS